MLFRLLKPIYITTSEANNVVHHSISKREVFDTGQTTDLYRNFYARKLRPRLYYNLSFLLRVLQADEGIGNTLKINLAGNPVLPVNVTISQCLQ